MRGAPLITRILLAALAFRAEARADELTLRGFVRDKATLGPVAGARVSVTGARSRADQTTDDGGFFHLALPGLTAGTLVRLRVEKDGYAVFDRNVSASGELPIEVAIVPNKRALRGGPEVAPTVTAAFLEQLKSPSPQLRAAAATAFGRRDIADKTAIPALASAMQDPDFHVRMAALDAMAEGKRLAPALLPIVAARFFDPEIDVTLRALSVVKLFGARARPVVPELLDVLDGLSPNPQAVCRIAVHSLLAIGEHDDPRLKHAFVSTLLDSVTSSDQSDLFAVAQRYPDLLLSQLPRLAAILAKETDSNTLNDQLAAMAILPHAGARGRKILLEQADQPHRRAPLLRTSYLLAWILQDTPVRQEILRAPFTSGLLAGLRTSVAAPDGELDPLLSRAESTGFSTPARLMAALGLFALGDEGDRNEEVWQVLEDALRGKMRSGSGALVARALPALPRSTLQRGLSVAIDVLVGCEPLPPERCDAQVVGPLATALESLGDEATFAALATLADSPNPRVRATARQARARIRARLGPATSGPAVSD